MHHEELAPLQRPRYGCESGRVGGGGSRALGRLLFAPLPLRHRFDAKRGAVGRIKAAPPAPLQSGGALRLAVAFLAATPGRIPDRFSGRCVVVLLEKFLFI